MLVAIVRKYQHFDAATGQPGATRSLRAYARLLGISPTHLSHIYSGERNPGLGVVSALLREFPSAREELLWTLAAPADAPVEVRS